MQMFADVDSRLVLVSHRAAGLHGVDALDISPSSKWLAIGSRAGLYLYPPSRGPGVLVRRANVNAMAAAETRVFVALDNRVENVPVNADSVRDWPGIDARAPRFATCRSTRRARCSGRPPTASWSRSASPATVSSRSEPCRSPAAGCA